MVTSWYKLPKAVFNCNRLYLIARYAVLSILLAFYTPIYSFSYHLPWLLQHRIRDRSPPSTRPDLQIPPRTTYHPKQERSKASLLVPPHRFLGPAIRFTSSALLPLQPTLHPPNVIVILSARLLCIQSLFASTRPHLSVHQMSGTTPPEVDPLDFNQIFSGLQQDQHNKRQNSNGSSFGGYYDHATPDQGQGQVQRHRSGSNLSQGYQQSSEESRQNSFPLEQSTLIATGNAHAAGRRLSGANIHQRQESGPSAFMGYGDAGGAGQQEYLYTQYLDQNYDIQPFQSQPQQQEYQTPYQLPNENNYASTSTANQSSTPNWGDQFLQDSNQFQDPNQMQGGNQYDSQGQSGGNYTGEGSVHNGLGESSFDANLAEL